jgi:uncharacterized protein YndB with AHSA1/START domain
MATPVDIAPANARELVIASRLAAPAAALYRCWTEPKLLARWFSPTPLTTEVLELDVRPGGRHALVIRDPSGGAFPSVGVFLAVEPNRRLVLTDAFERAWIPSRKPEVATEVTFEDLGGGETLYVARARHFTVEDAQAHEARGFLAGWGRCTVQLEKTAQELGARASR